MLRKVRNAQRQWSELSFSLNVCLYESGSGQGRIALLHTPHVEGSDTSTCQAVMIYIFTGEDAPVADRTKMGST